MNHAQPIGTAPRRNHPGYGVPYPHGMMATPGLGPGGAPFFPVMMHGAYSAPPPGVTAPFLDSARAGGPPAYYGADPSMYGGPVYGAPADASGAGSYEFASMAASVTHQGAYGMVHDPTASALPSHIAGPGADAAPASAAPTTYAGAFDMSAVGAAMPPVMKDSTS